MSCEFQDLCVRRTVGMSWTRCIKAVAISSKRCPGVSRRYWCSRRHAILRRATAHHNTLSVPICCVRLCHVAVVCGHSVQSMFRSVLPSVRSAAFPPAHAALIMRKHEQDYLHARSAAAIACVGSAVPCKMLHGMLHGWAQIGLELYVPRTGCTKIGCSHHF